MFLVTNLRQVKDGNIDVSS